MKDSTVSARVENNVKIEAEDGIEESKIKEKIENIGFDVK